MAIVILIKTPDGEVSEFPILNRVVLGRSSSCDFKISDSKMSGTHCAFEVSSKGQLLFKDLGSTNGSFLNNSAVQEVHVKINDVIKIGDTLIQIYEKRLSPSDKTAIGYSTVKPTNDKTLPELADLNKSPKEKTIMLKKSQQDQGKKRAVIGLSDKMRQEKEKEKESRDKMKMGSTKNVMDRESSGHTKFLELEEEREKKKKKG